MSEFLDDELRVAVDLVTRGFRKRVVRYDDRKYPKDAYEALRRAFGQPEATTGGDIRRALEWKYGHWGKANYPEHHRVMADRIWARWRAFTRANPGSGQGIFDYWMKALRGRTTRPFITVTFLLHLLRPDEFPIIDQHTFRTMNWLMRKVRPTWKGKKLPSNFDDVARYAEFFKGLHRAWPTTGGRPTGSDLDRALMVRGQELKGALRPGRRA